MGVVHAAELTDADERRDALVQRLFEASVATMVTAVLELSRVGVDASHGDVIVADHYGKMQEGAFFGDNLAQGIFSQSGNGAIVYGQARDIVGVREIEGFNTWVKAWHPSSSNERMLASINEMIRIGEAVVLPGDVVLATEGGVIFIPPHLAERVVVNSEVIRLVDGFRIEGMGEGQYTNQQVYASDWTDSINEDFYSWLVMNRTRLHEEYYSSYEIIDKLIETRDRHWQNWLDD
jgi:4-hydroxy-4-methyl-2-oxoglutarate aldolase